jgi:MFS family permease
MGVQQASTSAPSAAPFKILGLDATPELLAIILVYFVQGILGISRLAVSFYFKDELGLDPAELAIFAGFSALPWLIKPVYGFLSDTMPIFGYRRRSYLALCGIIGSIAWGTLAISHPSPALTTLLLLVASAGTACSDVVVDSLVVEASRDASASVAGVILQAGHCYPPVHAQCCCCARRTRLSQNASEHLCSCIPSLKHQQARS